MARIATGPYTGTGAAINVSIGWVPDYVRVINVTDGDNAWEWTSSNTNGHALFQRTVTDNATTGNASLANITSNGITPYAGTDTAGSEAAPGFTVGSALSESGKTFFYLAIAEDDCN